MAISRWKTAHFITIIGFVTVWHEEKCSGFGLATTINCWRCIWSMFSICCCCWLLAFHNVYFSVCSMSLELLWEIYNDFCITSFSYWSTHRMQFYTDSKYGRMPMALTQWATNKERIGDKHVCLQSTPIQGILENEHFIEYRHPQHSAHSLYLHFLLSLHHRARAWAQVPIRIFWYALKIVQHKSGPTTIIMNLQFCYKHSVAGYIAIRCFSKFIWNA